MTLKTPFTDEKEGPVERTVAALRVRGKSNMCVNSDTF